MTVVGPSPYRLTELTDCGGCAAKLGADLLAEAIETGRRDPVSVGALRAAASLIGPDGVTS